MTADQTPTLPVVERDALRPPLRRLAGSDAAEPVDWQVEQLSGGFGNPVSLGLYRVRGTGRDGRRQFPWSMVLKIAQSPANVGMAVLGGGDDVTHWNYWRREAHLYQSDLLSRLPAGLETPRFYGAADRPGDVCWLWLEEISDSYGGRWPVARYGLAARHLGRLSAAYLSGWDPARYPWLGRPMLRQWLTESQGNAPLLPGPEAGPAVLDHPALARLFPERAPFAYCIDNHRRLLDALDRRPQTLGHQDAYPTNLMSRPGADGAEATVALDWALAGIAPLGAEPAQLFLGLFQNTDDLTEAAAERLLMTAYLAGLRDAGWDGDEQEVRFGFTASSLLRLMFLLLYFLGSSPAGQSDDDLAALVRDLATPARLLTYLAPRAADLLNAYASD